MNATQQSPLQLHHLSRRRLHLRLPASRRANRRRLRPAVPMRRAMPVRRAVPMRRRRQLRPSPEPGSLPKTVPAARPHATAGTRPGLGRRPASTRRNLPVNSFALGLCRRHRRRRPDGHHRDARRPGGPDAAASTSPWSAAGRWACCAGNGRMPTSPAPRHGRARCGLGWAFHFLVGGGGVALLYAAFVPCHGLHAAHPSPLGRCDLRCGHVAAALAAAAAGLRLGLVRAARAARRPTPCWRAPSRTFPTGWASGSSWRWARASSPSRPALGPFGRRSTLWTSLPSLCARRWTTTPSGRTTAHHVPRLRHASAELWPDTLRGALRAIAVAAVFWALAATLLYVLVPGLDTWPRLLVFHECVGLTMVACVLLLRRHARLRAIQTA